MTLIYFIIVLSVTIFIHELGHFIFAKKAKIHVYEFCVGMGPRLIKWTRKNDETEYGIRLFPIGGFCSMAGENIEIDENVPKDKLLQSKTWGQKFMTIVAGVMFNFIFAFIILFIVGLINGNPNTKPIVSNVLENSVLKSGDLILEVNDIKVKNIDRFMLEYQVNYGKNLELTILRDDKQLDIEIEPKVLEDGTYQYGFGLNEDVEKGFFEAIKYAFTKFVSLISQMYLTVFYLFTGKISLSNLSGPIGIYNIVGQSAKLGIVNLIYLTGYLSINVGVINLLPLPAFDGGRLLFLIIEKIIRKPVNPKVENIIHTIGFALLMLLMVAITYNDIIRFIIK
ncbi:MAG: RIP metalloprotease RseP [Firmicutes bacterium]|nr:RIP metalloprotease RseP [Bacillota bacterium]